MSNKLPDLEALLAKYIDHVGAMEGVDFIPKGIGKERGWISTEPFTQEEIEVLWKCAGWDEEKGEWIDE